MIARRGVGALAAVTAAVVAALALAGCSDSRQSPRALPAGPHRPRAVFVVIGGRESSGAGLDDALHIAWPQRVFGSRFPNGTVYINLATNDTTVAEARARQAPVAVEQRPTVAAVWLGEGDDDVGTDPAQFAKDLRAILGQLRRAGTARVLVASPPPGAAGSRFAPEIAAAARSTGAVLVPLSSAAWDPHAPAARRPAVQAAAAAELGRAVKG